MLENYNDVLAVSDLMEILPLGRSTIYNLLKTRTIKSIQVGGRYIIPKPFLLEFLATVG